MKDKLLTTTIAMIALSLLTGALFFLPVGKILSSLPFIRDLQNNTSLVITSQNSKLLVEIDGKDYGETPLLLDSLETGQYTVKLTRISPQEENFYTPVELLIELQKNTESIIEIEIAPAGIYTGYMLQYSTSPFGDKKSYISVNSNSKTTILIDGKEVGNSPLAITEITPGEHSLTASANGYESMEVPIVATKGYNLNVNLYLYPIPIMLEEVKVEDGEK